MAPPKATDSPFRPGKVCPFRVEAWRHGRFHYVLVMAPKGHHNGKGDSVEANMMAYDPGTKEVLFSEGRFDDPRALQAPAFLVASVLKPILPGSDAGFYKMFGQVAGVDPRPHLSPDGFAPDDVDAMPLLATQVAERIANDTRAARRGIERQDANAEDLHLGRRLPAKAHRFSFGGKGYPLNRPVLIPYVQLPDYVSWQGRTAKGIFDFEDPSHGTLLFGFDDIRKGVAEKLEAALGPARELLHSEATAILGSTNWSRATHDFYAADGAAGERRRQAGRLYPALAPLLADDAQASELIDAGRPFEPRLAEILSDFPLDVPPVSLARLRRFRSLGNEIELREILALVRETAALPVDWLPGTGEGWQACRAVLREVAGFLGRGVALQDLLQNFPGQWRRFLDHAGGLVPSDTRPDHILFMCDYAALTPIHVRLRDADDLPRALTETLLGPLLRSVCERMDVPHWKVGTDPFTGAEGIDLWTQARRLLFGGRSVLSAMRVSEAWHAGQEAYEANLPVAARQRSWPALLTRAVTAPNGVEAVCLTSEVQLKAEGRSQPDASGARGLGHCVGGYGRRCLLGDSHIVSLRKPLPGGGYERLSTVEFFLDTEGRPVVAQHRARDNAEPPEEAQEALRCLLLEINDVPALLNPAVRERPAGDPDDEADGSYDWRVPGNLEMAFAAWAPYLPRPVAAAGLDGLRARTEALVGELLAAKPDLAMFGDELPGEDPWFDEDGPQAGVAP